MIFVSVIVINRYCFAHTDGKQKNQTLPGCRGGRSGQAEVDQRLAVLPSRLSGLNLG